jgi:hypothetical protein
VGSFCAMGGRPMWASKSSSSLAEEETRRSQTRWHVVVAPSDAAGGAVGDVVGSHQEPVVVELNAQGPCLACQLSAFRLPTSDLYAWF